MIQRSFFLPDLNLWLEVKCEVWKVFLYFSTFPVYNCHCLYLLWSRYSPSRPLISIILHLRCKVVDPCLRNCGKRAAELPLPYEACHRITSYFSKQSQFSLMHFFHAPPFLQKKLTSSYPILPFLITTSLSQE